jgi:hypothetical protein
VIGAVRRVAGIERAVLFSKLSGRRGAVLADGHLIHLKPKPGRSGAFRLFCLYSPQPIGDPTFAWVQNNVHTALISWTHGNAL